MQNRNTKNNKDIYSKDKQLDKKEQKKQTGHKMKTRRKTNKRTERRQDIKLGKIRTQDNYNNQKKTTNRKHKNETRQRPNRT